MTSTTRTPARRTSQRRHSVPDRVPGESDSRAETVKSATDVRAELEALMEALREANGHLIVANLRSQTLAEQMNQLYEEARRAIEAKDEFFTVISHELRTPLTSITGWAALLTMDPDPATIAEGLRAISNSAAVQAQLIDDLLDVSRIMTNKFALTRQDIDLRNVITESVSGMHPLAAAKDIALRMSLEQSMIIDGDPGRMRQVLTNLIGNAIKFTPSGGVIETRLFREESFAIVEVSDTGEGISAQFLPHVFDRRAQATERRFAGLGLGLAIVKHIVELHGGSVTVSSEGAGKGATFTLRLPSAR